MNGGADLGGLETVLSSNGPQEAIDRASGMAIVSDLRSQVLQQASATSVVAGVLQRQAAQAQAQQVAAAQEAESARARAQATADGAQAETVAIQRQQSELITQLAALQHTSVALEGQRQAGLKAEAEARAAAAAKALAERRAREEAARREAARQEAARREAAQREADRKEADRKAAERRREERRRQARPPRPRWTRPAPAPVDPPPPPRADPPPAPTRGGVGAVIAYAQAQIGEPYLWGAEGPGSFDCSGLTMKAWQQAGVYLSHYTGAQWAETDRVPIATASPVTSLLRRSGGSSHHVGLYVGGGQMIEAPHTGAYVRVRRHLPLRPCCPGRRQGALTGSAPTARGHALRPATRGRRLASWSGFSLAPAPRDAGCRPGGRHSVSAPPGLGIPSVVLGQVQRAVDMPASLARSRASTISSSASPGRPSARPRPTCRARGPCRSRRSAGSPGGRTR